MRKPCRCLAADLPDGQELAGLIRERIEGIPEEERTGDTEYRRRLDLCQQCGSLLDGTCALCGCYAEIRAARSWQRCPDVPPRWEKF